MHWRDNAQFDVDGKMLTTDPHYLEDPFVAQVFAQRKRSSPVQQVGAKATVQETVKIVPEATKTLPVAPAGGNWRKTAATLAVGIALGCVLSNIF
jgi:hypothetical protein